jgi:hypothetical protein
VTVASRTLYRPVGLKEAELILKAEGKAFPPRLPEQPYFYPVLNFEYAQQIARDWNTKAANSGYAGFVTEFQVDADYIAKFEVQTVGAAKHQELWIPAEELAGFNEHILGRIQFIAAYYGSGYKGIKHWHDEKYADETLLAYHWTSPFDLNFEVWTNRHAIFLNFRYWVEKDYGNDLPTREKTQMLRLITSMWNMKFADIPLLGSEQL